MDRPPVARRALENEAVGEFASGNADAGTWLCPGVAAGWHQYLPHAFTEHGDIMAVNVLNSPRALVKEDAVPYRTKRKAKS